jgi:uncharacterized metal-binding protein
MIWTENGIKIIEYGHGSIVTTCCEVEGAIGLGFIPTDKKEIGTPCETVKKGDLLHEQGADTMIFFKNKAGFDMFYAQVEALKEQFEGGWPLNKAD